MPRKLKTFITNIGFFELALAAPSMKAALEAWGMGHNAFQQGFARETDDPKIVAATMANPGVVLRRPVGTKGEFKENAEMSADSWKLTPVKSDAPKITPKAVKPKAKKAPARGETKKADQAAILSFEKAKAQRDAARKKDEERQEAEREKDRARIERALAKADEALERAKSRHEQLMAAIAEEREALDQRAAAEKKRWELERAQLEKACERAKT